MRASLIALAMCASGCGGARPAGEAPSAGQASHASPAEFKPRAAFRAYAAKVLGVPPADLEGGTTDAASAAAQEHSRGRAWQFQMWHKLDGFAGVRGWVTADGTVITADQNLGVLLAEDGLWSTPRTQRLDELADRLAEDIVWSYGPGTTLERAAGWGVEPPALVLAADGSGTLRFFSNDHGGARGMFAPGGSSTGGGGGAPPDTYWVNDVVLTAEHGATLSRKPFQTRPDR
jgi:hypothetical protein